MIRLPIAPRQRPDPVRATTWAGKRINRNPDAYAAWLQAASLLVRSLWIGGRTEGPVELRAVFVIAAPKRQAAKLWGLPVATRPDLDRYAHGLMDAITQAGKIWKDDGQVAKLTVTKRYQFEAEEPCIHFAVEVA